MPHADSLILTLVGGFVLAFVFGMLANRLKLSPLVGYLVAGVVVGPFTPGYVADTELAPQLAEIGVILLMFGVGLHFSPKDLMQVRKVAIPGALVQISAATALGWVLGRFALGLPYDVALNPMAISQLRVAITNGGFDVVHAHIGVISPFSMDAVRMTLGMGIPTAVTWHSVMSWAGPLLRPLGFIKRWAAGGAALSAVSRVAARPVASMAGAGHEVVVDAMSMPVLANGDLSMAFNGFA